MIQLFRLIKLRTRFNNLYWLIKLRTRLNNLYWFINLRIRLNNLEGLNKFEHLKSFLDIILDIESPLVIAWNFILTQAVI